MALGILAGWHWGASTIPLGAVGKTYIQLIKVIAIPLVLCSIVEAVIATDLSLKTASRWLLVIAINTICALVIGLSLSNIVRPGDGFPSSMLASPSGVAHSIKEFWLSGFLSSIIPESIVQPFAENNVLSIVLLALLVGLALRAYLREPNAEVSLESAQRMGRAANGVINKILLFISYTG
jgi:Na+/H+-dicarboxylate symporter